MTTFIKTMLKKSDDQTNIDKYRISYHNKINDVDNYFITSKINMFKMAFFW